MAARPAGSRYFCGKKDTYQDYKTSTGGDLLGDTQGKGTKNNVIYNDPPGKDSNASSTYSSTTWINSEDVTRILNSGTDITIQAISTSGAASISLESPLTIDIASTASKNPTFTLEANRNITIAKDIKTSGSKGLNIILNADTDGDGMGAVIINADITTNGGFLSRLQVVVLRMGLWVMRINIISKAIVFGIRRSKWGVNQIMMVIPLVPILV